MYSPTSSINDIQQHQQQRSPTSNAAVPRRRLSSAQKNRHDTHHQSVISMSSVSSKGSSNYTRYPSGMTNLTAFSSETSPSLCLSPSSSTPATTVSYSSPYSKDNRLSEDQFDIINSLEYDDVDDALIDHELIHRNREALVQQLYNSETAYLESLHLVTNVFLQPLRKDAKSSSFAFLGMKKMVCTERETRWLFGNFDEIFQTHRDILSHLERRLRIWGPTQIISDVFNAWFPMLHVYQAYLDNYDVAVTTYERLTRYQPFKKFIDSAHKDPSLKGATLLSLLQIPAGCINRYAQLIGKLADVTTPMHPDYMGLQTCKQRIMALATEIKLKVDDADNVDQVLMIHQALVGAPFGVKAQRRLVLQGQLSRVVVNSRSTGEERTYFLFSDLLAFVRPKQDGKRTILQYKGHITLERARVRGLTTDEAGGQEHCIEIVSSFQGVDTLNTTYMGAPTTHVLCCNSKEEQEEWLKQLDLVITLLDRATARAKNMAANRRMQQNRSMASETSLRRFGGGSRASSHSSGGSTNGSSSTTSRPGPSSPSPRR
ncbi:Dbl homology domain-containing protein [Phascolomyces articulosus]|uniref:Dbl homology domain-containing protein n=1 Tax=Phascolomyces articulosus TaxID=60185 RepID=A0AAD5JPH4_9FUNG|nr:Dbl homology domain-containing protein [Phascolomyces articulosus]